MKKITGFFVYTKVTNNNLTQYHSYITGLLTGSNTQHATAERTTFASSKFVPSAGFVRETKDFYYSEHTACYRCRYCACFEQARTFAGKSAMGGVI